MNYLSQIKLPENPNLYRSSIGFMKINLNGMFPTAEEKVKLKFQN